MNLIRKILGGNGIAEDYDYYVIYQRTGGIYGRWDEIDKRKDFLDKVAGYATYSDGSDLTLRCFGVKKFGDREIKKQLWITYSREDIDEDIEERKKRTGRKDSREDDIDKYLRILNSARDEEREKLEGLMGMMSTFYQNQYEVLMGLSQQNSEANKYSVWQQGIHELSEVGKEIVHELSGKGNSEEGTESDEKETTFDEYNKKSLPPGREKPGRKDAGKPAAAITLIARWIEKKKSPESFLDVIEETSPKFHAALQSMKLEELLELLKPYTEKIPVLGTEEAKEWLAVMFEIIHPEKDEVKEAEAET